MPVLVKLRAQDLDAPGGRRRHRRSARTGGGAAAAGGGAASGDAAVPQRDSLAGMHGSVAMEVLGRRLDHIEHAARKVARLAARPVIEDI